MSKKIVLNLWLLIGYIITGIGIFTACKWIPVHENSDIYYIGGIAFLTSLAIKITQSLVARAYPYFFNYLKKYESNQNKTIPYRIIILFILYILYQFNILGVYVEPYNLNQELLNYMLLGGIAWQIYNLLNFLAVILYPNNINKEDPLEQKFKDFNNTISNHKDIGIYILLLAIAIFHSIMSIQYNLDSYSTIFQFKHYDEILIYLIIPIYILSLLTARAIAIFFISLHRLIFKKHIYTLYSDFIGTIFLLSTTWISISPTISLFKNLSF